MVEKLVEKFQQYQISNSARPTLEEIQFLCSNEEHEIFAFDHYLFRDIMHFRDDLELDGF